MAIGFIGLGNMGLPMAQCLTHSGLEVLAWDVNSDAMRAIGSEVESLTQLAERCNQFITMLPAGVQVSEVYEQLLTAELPSACLFIDCSTIDVITTRLLAQKISVKGHEFVDAPVSGGSEAASTGSLSFMLGGTEAGFAQADPLLKVMGSKVTTFGAAGAGQSAKACHNMICGISALGVCEAFALANSLGLDQTRFFELCQGAAAQSWILENRCPVPGPAPSSPASNEYAPGFAARLMAKDLALAQQAANDTGQKTEFGAQAAKRFQAFVDGGGGDLDFSAIYRDIEK